MRALKRVLVVALVGSLMVGVGLGCWSSNSNTNTANTDKGPSTTHSSMYTPTRTAPPAETRVEPQKSWGEDTRKNLEKGVDNP